MISFLGKLPCSKINKSFFQLRNFSVSNSSTFGAKLEEKISIKDKVALVTGGGGSIGYAVAHCLLKNGASAVTILDKDAKKGESAADNLCSTFGNGKSIFYKTEVTNSRNVDSAFINTVMHFQGLDIVVNCAGMMNDTKWEEQIQTNMTGTVVTTLLGLQHMSISGPGQGGTVVNVCSIIGIIPSLGCPLHTMTQFGIVGFCRALGKSDQFNRTKVKIIGFCPGPTESPLLKEAQNAAINTNFYKEFQQELEGCLIQSPEIVANGLCNILGKAKSGSIWIAENNEAPYEVVFPDVVHQASIKPELTLSP